MTSYIIAVDLGGTQIRAALCDPHGQMYRRVAKLTRAQEGPDAVQARIKEAIAETMEGVGAEAVIGIGIGAPGPLDPASGIILAAPNLPGWVNVPLRNLISTHFGKPTFLGNDANVAGLAEVTYGAARGVKDVVYLTISTGIGSGIISGGKMLLGARGLAAEAGHMMIKPDGPKCGCGNRGCLEALAAGPAISRDVIGRLKAGKGGKSGKVLKLAGGDLDRVDARVIGEAAAAGDKLAINAFRRAGKYLGLGIVNLLHLFNPRMVVLGGSVTKAGPLLFEPMWETIRARAMPGYLDGLAIVPAALGDDVGLLGALALAVTELGIKE
ncbi:MAG: ROK family protein [Anaerolineae bacterium]